MRTFDVSTHRLCCVREGRRVGRVVINLFRHLISSSQQTINSIYYILRGRVAGKIDTSIRLDDSSRRIGVSPFRLDEQASISSRRIVQTPVWPSRRRNSSRRASRRNTRGKIVQTNASRRKFIQTKMVTKCQFVPRNEKSQVFLQETYTFSTIFDAVSTARRRDCSTLTARCEWAPPKKMQQLFPI